MASNELSFEQKIQKICSDCIKEQINILCRTGFSNYKDECLNCEIYKKYKEDTE